MSAKPSAYEELGVSATKQDVHEAIADAGAGLFPGAFCQIGPDVLGGDPNWCCVSHCDGAGTKALAAYLLYKETGDAGVFRHTAQDAFVMNTDDLACIGAVERYLVSNAIGRNSFHIPGEVIKQIVQGYESCFETLRQTGVEVAATGGETADLVDNVRTIVVDATVTARLLKDRVIDNQNIRPGDVIVGLSSTGQARYESRPNSGIGSNGLTLARHCLLSNDYLVKYPESVAPEIDPGKVYRGAFHLHDEPVGLGMTVGEALTSPTRTYVPVLRDVLAAHRPAVHGVVHNTGGGQTKCKNFGKGIAYIKDDLFDCPPLFRLIAEQGNIDGREMYQTFNMGHRLELMVAPEVADQVVAVAAQWNIEAKIIGRCEASQANRLTIQSEFGDFEY